MNEKNLDEGTLEAMRTEQHPDRNRPDVPDDVTCELRKGYGETNGRVLTGDVFTPVEIPTEPRLAIVFLHGGSWQHGGPSQFHSHSRRLASEYGFFCISVDYRMSEEAPFPAALQDSKCAIRWVRSQAEAQNIDTDRIVISGGSAGGHLSSMILTTVGVEEYEGDAGWSEYSSEAHLGVIFNGEFDMWDLVEKGSLLEPMRLFMGGTPEEVPERYDELSSLHRVHKDVAPVLQQHGTEDLCVSHEQAIAFHEKLKSVGVHSEVEIYEGKPHAWFNREPDRTITTDRMIRFLIEQLGL
jgi:acetyl esterase/lipase